MTDVLGLVILIILYFGILGVMKAVAPPYIGPKVEPTKAMQRRAMERYGWLVEELEEQFFERLRLLRRMPFLSPPWRELRAMMWAVAARIRDVKETDDG